MATGGRGTQNATQRISLPTWFAAQASRWWTYQRERFPILAHGPLIAAFSLSAVSLSSLLRGQAELPSVKTALVAFVTAFLFFLQLRLADEFKDFEEDSKYRPYRPVPRGLVTLRELGVLWAITAVIQLLLALWLQPSLVLLLGGVCVYLALMSKEFFIGGWLKVHPIPYLISHMAIIPLVDLYATACDWWPATGWPPQGLIWFLVVSYFNGIVIEVGRKIRAPADEEPGVNTYTVLWGRRNALLGWLGALVTTAVLAFIAAWQIAFVVPVAVLLSVLLLTAALLAFRFSRHPTTQGGKGIEVLAGVWTVLMYLSLGAVPLAWRVGTGAAS
jgi:4-hydroxybenzoate polyprenyltransferase